MVFDPKSWGKLNKFAQMEMTHDAADDAAHDDVVEPSEYEMLLERAHKLITRISNPSVRQEVRDLVQHMHDLKHRQNTEAGTCDSCAGAGVLDDGTECQSCHDPELSRRAIVDLPPMPPAEVRKVDQKMPHDIKELDRALHLMREQREQPRVNDDQKTWEYLESLKQPSRKPTKKK